MESGGCNVLHSSFQTLQAGFYSAPVPRQIPLSQPSYESLVFTQRSSPQALPWGGAHPAALSYIFFLLRSLLSMPFPSIFLVGLFVSPSPILTSIYV
jgi:hypothetical protein